MLQSGSIQCWGCSEIKFDCVTWKVWYQPIKVVLDSDLSLSSTSFIRKGLNMCVMRLNT